MEDRVVLNSIVGETLARSQARVHAFCWMTNHLHALVQISDIPLAPIMQRIAMRYARYRHRRLDTTGHLFERRYGARFINDDAYFLTVLRYIHLNPCKANLVVDPTDYPWSSHGAYLGRRSVPWLTTEFGLSLFHPQPARARAAYRLFMTLAEHDAEQAHREPPLTLEGIAEEVCGNHGVDVRAVRSPSRARYLTPARTEIARQALGAGIATLREIGLFLGRETSAVWVLLSKYRA